MKKQEQLKLFVWEGVLTDYTDGVMFALAHNIEEAKDLIRQKAGEYELKDIEYDLKNKPLIVKKPEGFYLFGGS